MIVAIDGPGAAGKGTLARRLARALDFAVLDTGLLYRAVAARILAAGGDPSDRAAAAAAAAALTPDCLDGPDLRTEAIGEAASIVAAIPAVREALLALQRDFARHPPGGKRGAVLDGRDIGTVVCPEADVKLFVTASPETRARRRHKELLDRGEPSIYARVVQEMQARDTRDSGRAAAPLRPAPDAIVLDTSDMDAEAAFRTAMGIIAARREAGTTPGPADPDRDRRDARAQGLGRPPEPTGWPENATQGRNRYMAEPATETSAATKENFAALLEESLGTAEGLEGTVLKGTVIAIEGDAAVVDVGLKSEGRVALKEFSEAGRQPEIRVGDEVEVYLERMENKDGLAVLSRDKAKREEAWTQLDKAFKDSQRVTGIIFGRVKGGFTVDLSGAVAFLPGSQVDIRPVRDIGPLMGSPQPFQILKMDRSRGNIVVSRRAVLEETRAVQRSELIAGLKEGQVLDGVVKNITDYGAFVDLGGIDGLLHVTDISWKRINHPTEALSIGQQVKVQVIRFNPETQRISLGMKQLEADPWEGVGAKYPIGTKFLGRVTNITDYGAFVELEAGIEGLVHVSEMSWTKKNIHPGKIVSTSQEVEVMVLDVDEQKRRISLGLKQCLANPWDAFLADYAPGAELEGEIKNITEFGLFVGLPGEIDGMVHFSDLDWSLPGEEAVKKYKKGDRVRVKVLDVDIAKERISLGIKQLSEDPFDRGMAELKKGAVVTCTVHQVADGGIEVQVRDGLIGFIRKSELSRERSEQRPDRFAVGEKVDAKITAIDSKSRKITLSIKQREVEEEKKAMADYGSTESGASLGEILGAAISKAAQEREAAGEDEAVAEPAKGKAAKGKAAKAKPAKPKTAKKTEEGAKAAKPKKAKKAAAKDDAAAADAGDGPGEAAESAAHDDAPDAD